MTHSKPGSHSAVATGQDTVLVVDDEPAVRTLYSRALRDAGFATLEAVDGIEAVEIVERHPVSLLLLDSTMPRLDGPGVIRAVRDRPETSTLPIILVTANAGLEDRVQGLAAGADDYLAKPVALDELEARVRAQLRSHAAWAEAFDREAAQRRAMTAALRRVGRDGTAEHVASSLVNELVPALGVDALAIASVRPDGAIVALAAAGAWAERFRPGLLLDSGPARRLLEETAEGPWVITRDPVSDASLPDGSVAAVFSLNGSNGPIGLLGVQLTPGATDRSGLARRLPLFIELADLSAVILGPAVEFDGARLQFRAALETVVASQAFQPHFQPIVSLADGAIVAYEALTRFDDRTPPDRRFAEAVRLGLGCELEAATVGVAIEASRALPSAAGLGLNVSPEFVLSGRLPAILADPGRQIVLEITEHAPIDDYPALQAALALIQPPVLVAVDDAGSGYASLRHIFALRPAFVKLDIGWVREIDRDPARQALVAGVVHFAREVGCQLIGEGIEAEAERTTLLRLGVQLGQGYLLGEPAPVVARQRD